MIRIGLIIATAFLTGLMACENKVNDFDLDKDPLRGVIGGKEWDFSAGKAEYTTGTSGIASLLLATDTQDACATVVTVDPHVTLAFPAVRGNYTLSVDQVSVIFVPAGNTVKYTATSGFLEVVAISRTEVVGYLSADFDENNNVQGSFLLTICN